jgi:hypothetical protein
VVDRRAGGKTRASKRERLLRLVMIISPPVVSAALAEVDKVAQCPTLKQFQSLSNTFKCHGPI